MEKMGNILENLFNRKSAEKLTEMTLKEIGKKAEKNHNHPNYEQTLDTLEQHVVSTLVHVSPEFMEKWNSKIGKQTTGEQVEYEKGKKSIAKTGAEISNDYSPRTYSSAGEPVTGNVSVGLYSSTKGSVNTSVGDFSTTEGGANISRGMYSRSGGCKNEANGGYSDVGGLYNIANNLQTVRGKYNKETKDSNDIFILGNGTGINMRSNCLRMNATEGLFITGAYNTNGADYGEYFEWNDGNPDAEDRIGKFVKLVGDKIELATNENDDVIGIISGNASVIGNSFDDHWSGMYVTDIYGRVFTETVTVDRQTIIVPDPNDYSKTIEQVIVEEHEEVRPMLNVNYDPTKEYIPRSQREEWDVVGMLGKLILDDDGTCVVGEWCKPSENGVGTVSHTKTKFKVINRLNNSHVTVLVVP